MRAFLFAAVLLLPAVAQGQRYWVPHQAWGFRPYAHPAPAYNPHFHARVQAHQMHIARQRAMNPWGAALDDLRWEMLDEMDRRARDEVMMRRVNPRQWWEQGAR